MGGLGYILGMGTKSSYIAACRWRLDLRISGRGERREARSLETCALEDDNNFVLKRFLRITRFPPPTFPSVPPPAYCPPFCPRHLQIMRIRSPLFPPPLRSLPLRHPHLLISPAILVSFLLASESFGGMLSSEGETLHLSSLMPFTSRRLFSRIRCFISVKNRAAPRYSPFLFRKSDRDEEGGRGGGQNARTIPRCRAVLFRCVYAQGDF